MYVTDLVVANTVNTMPEKTLQAFADHGEVRGDQVSGTKAEAQQLFDDLASLGIDFDDVVRSWSARVSRSSTRRGQSWWRTFRSRSTRPRPENRIRLKRLTDRG